MPSSLERRYLPEGLQQATLGGEQQVCGVYVSRLSWRWDGIPSVFIVLMVRALRVASHVTPFGP